MLGFFSNKTVHPLADSREVKRILAEIANPGRGALSAVEDAGAWLESLAADESFKLAQRVDLILRIDEATAAQARRLGREFPVSLGLSRTQESKQWQCCHGYWQHLVDSYLDCITRYRAAVKEEDAIRPQLPMIYGRLISALAAQLKCCLLYTSDAADE